MDEEYCKGGKRHTSRARKELKGTPQGAPISPLLSNLYIHRFILDWKKLGYARHFGAEIVNSTDDFCVLGKASAVEMLAAVKRIMDNLKLPINEQKTRCLWCPDEAFEFLGYSIGRNYRRNSKGNYIGTRPRQVSVQSICRRIIEQTTRRYGWMETEESGTLELDDVRMGELFPPRTSQPYFKQRLMLTR